MMAVDIESLTRELVAINSANPATCAEGRGEAEIADFCTRWLDTHGVHARLEFPAGHPARPAVVAVSEGREPGRSILLLGHLDTFTWYEPPMQLGSARIEGPGAFDMKGGLAAILGALVDIASRAHRGTVSALLVPDEEHGSFGVRAFAPSLHIDAAIVAEGTFNDIGTRHDGRIRTTIQTSTARQRDILIWTLAAMAKRGHPALKGVAVASVGSPTPGLIAQRVVAPGEDATHMAAILAAVLQPLVNEELRWDTRESFIADETGPLYACVKRNALLRAMRARATALAGWTEAAVLAAFGIPCIVFGPDGGAAHTRSEWVDVASARKVAHVLSDAVVEFCELPRHATSQGTR